jgi:beta-hydroxylase
MSFIETLRRKVRSAIVDGGEQFILIFEKFIGRFSLVGNASIFDPAQFAWTAELEVNWRAIRNELEQVLKYRDQLPSFHEISPDQSRITHDDKWKTFFLYGFGYKIDKNCQRCPETTKLIEKVPGMKTALFSILSPHKHIPEHRGVYKGLLRYHLGLIVPEPRARCRIRLGNDVVHWEEGKSILFDDTYLHEVWNDTDALRAVLFMDVVRPFRFPVSLLNAFIIFLVGLTPYVRDGIKNEAKWQKGFDMALKRSEKVAPRA